MNVEDLIKIKTGARAAPVFIIFYQQAMQLRFQRLLL